MAVRLSPQLPDSLKRRVSRGLRRAPVLPVLARRYEDYRQATSSLRLLPGFLVIGAQRAGTSSFYWNLVRHPALRPASHKEIHFFDRPEHWARGVAWYRSHFPLARYRTRAVTTGEATPAYLFRPHVPARVAALLPDVRLIVLLRDPVDRAYSNFHMSTRKGQETENFDEAVRRELGHLGDRPVTRANLEDCAVMPYLQRGVYAAQLRNWFEHFDRRRFLVLDARDFYRDPLRQLRRATSELLGLPDASPGRYHKHRKESVRYPAMSAESRTLLQDFFRPYNEELYDLLEWPRVWG